jgi:hypothetical protein
MAVLTDFWIKRRDTARPVVIDCLEDDEQTPVEEDFTGATVEFHMDVPGATVLVGDATIVDYDLRRLGYQWQDETETDHPAGEYAAEFEVTLEDGRVMTFPNDRNLTIHITEDLA